MANKKTPAKSGNIVAKVTDDIKKSQQRGAQEQLLQDLFEEMYANRGRVYRMNFIRGIFIGFGTVIGGTVVVAILIWALSFFINAPVIGDFIKEVLISIEK